MRRSLVHAVAPDHPLLALKARGQETLVPTKKTQPTDAESEFTRLAEALSKDPRVDPPSAAQARGFGSKGLKVSRKLFAFESKGRLVLKLPASRVESLASSGTGRPFDPGHGRIMKEWATIDFARKQLWPSLAREALEFAAANSATQPTAPTRKRKQPQRNLKRRRR
jgi:TfoX/Sxy family transcriptional regulator of competence genes